MRRGRSSQTLSLFAFQDIIMGVAGVMLFVLMLLVVQLALATTRVATAKQKTTVEVAKPERMDSAQGELQALEAELFRLQERIDESLQLGATSIDANLDQLQSQLEQLAYEIQQDQQRLAAQEKQLSAIIAERKGSNVSLQLDQLISEQSRLEQELDAWKQGNKVRFASTNDAQPRVWLIDVRQSNAYLFLLPHNSLVRQIEFSASQPASEIAKTLADQIDQTSSSRLLVVLRPPAARFGTELLPELKRLGFTVALEILDVGTEIGEPLL